MKRLHVLLAVTAIFFSPLVKAQKCGTDALWTKQILEDPTMLQKVEELNRQAQLQQNAVSSRAALYTIPVVFHVIHSNGEENISREQILDQIRVLNNDFSGNGYNKNNIRSPFKSLLTDVQIQFKLASIDPNGNCTDGINRIYSDYGNNASQTTEEVKSLSYWNSANYMNVWVVSSIKSESGAGTTLGYAYFPWMTPASKNGIVMRHDHVGTIGTAAKTDSGRTLTHEIGHWLGLYHTFQDGCQPGGGSGDLCDDTPPVSGAFVNSNCPANGNSCTNDVPDLIDMWENFMDYADGKCYSLFTPKQKARMIYFLTQVRSNISNASNLIATGVNLSSGSPIANFTANQRVVCAGTPVTFSDISCKAAVTGRSWSFPGANISSSSAANPTVIYQSPGKYKVSLLVQNGQGNNTKSVDEYIEVIALSSAKAPNIEEDLEDMNPTGKGLRSVTQKPWEWINTVGYSGTHCLKAPVSSTDIPGTKYAFVTPAYDLTQQNGVSPKITFYTAYAIPTSDNSEILRIYISTDCGNSFTMIYERSSFSLAYSGAQKVDNFVPSGKSNWKLLGVTSLNSLGYDKTKHAIFKIEVESAAGNPVYIDDINVGPWFSGTGDVQANMGAVQIYPNPANTNASVEFELLNNANVSVDLYDAMGRKVRTAFVGNLAKGPQKVILDNANASLHGVYYVKITTPTGQVSKPITFAN